MFCLCYPVIGGGLGDVSNERGVALAQAMTDRCVSAIRDWKAFEFLKASCAIAARPTSSLDQPGKLLPRGIPQDSRRVSQLSSRQIQRNRGCVRSQFIDFLASACAVGRNWHTTLKR